MVYLKTGLHGIEKAMRLVGRDLRLARRALRLAAVVLVYAGMALKLAVRVKILAMWSPRHAARVV